MVHSKGVIPAPEPGSHGLATPGDPGSSPIGVKEIAKPSKNTQTNPFCHPEPKAKDLSLLSRCLSSRTGAS